MTCDQGEAFAHRDLDLHVLGLLQRQLRRCDLTIQAGNNLPRFLPILSPCKLQHGELLAQVVCRLSCKGHGLQLDTCSLQLLALGVKVVSLRIPGLEVLF